jgi:hypothetical protein
MAPKMLTILGKLIVNLPVPTVRTPLPPAPDIPIFSRIGILIALGIGLS